MKTVYIISIALLLGLVGCSAHACDPAKSDTTVPSARATPKTESPKEARIKVKPVARRADGRMLLEPVSRDKFKLGPQGTNASGGSK